MLRVIILFGYSRVVTMSKAANVAKKRNAMKAVFSDDSSGKKMQQLVVKDSKSSKQKNDNIEGTKVFAPKFDKPMTRSKGLLNKP